MKVVDAQGDIGSDFAPQAVPTHGVCMMPAPTAAGLSEDHMGMGQI